MKNEIVIKIPKPQKLVGVVRVTPEAELVLQELSYRTGLSLRTLASEIIIQASEFIRIEGSDDDCR